MFDRLSAWSGDIDGVSLPDKESWPAESEILNSSSCGWLVTTTRSVTPVWACKLGGGSVSNQAGNVLCHTEGATHCSVILYRGAAPGRT